MLIEDSQYNTSGAIPKYEFEIEDLEEIITEFEKVEDILNDLINKFEKIMYIELDKFGKSKTKDILEEEYKKNARNAEKIREMCSEGARSTAYFIDEIECELGTLTDTTKFDIEDVMTGVGRINNRITTIINNINYKCTVPDFYISKPAFNEEDREDRKEIERYNKQIFENLTTEILRQNALIIEHIEDAVTTSHLFDNLDGRWSFNLGSDIKLDVLEYTNFRKFTDEIKLDNPRLENSDLRTNKEKEEDDTNAKLRSFGHSVLTVVEIGDLAISPFFPPAALVSMGAGLVNAGMYMAEGETGKGIVSAALAVPCFGTIGVLGKGLGKVKGKVAKVMSKVDLDMSGEFGKRVAETPIQIKVKEKYDTLLLQINNFIEKYENMSYGEILDDMNIYDTLVDLSVKPAISSLLSTTDGVYAATEVAEDTSSYVVNFFVTIMEYRK